MSGIKVVGICKIYMLLSWTTFE